MYQVSALQAMWRRYGDAFLTSRGFECMVEILYRAARLGLRISEVPMVLDGSRRAGKSKMRVLKTSLAYLRWPRGRSPAGSRTRTASTPEAPRPFERSKRSS